PAVLSSLSLHDALPIYPRVEPAIEQVHEQVADDEADRDQEDDALDERIVAREDGIDDQAPDAGEREDVLGDDRAADERAELQPEDRKSTRLNSSHVAIS